MPGRCRRPRENGSRERIHSKVKGMRNMFFDHNGAKGGISSRMKIGKFTNK